MSNEFIVKNGLIVGGNVVTSGTITINGALAATQSWVTSQAYLTSASLSGYATQSYVTSAIAALVNSAPAALDTLNELAAALGNDASFSTTITNSIASKQAQLNGTGFVKVSGTTVSYDNSTYLTSYTETDTLATVTGRGASTSTNISVNSVNIGTDATYGAAYRSVSFGYNGDGSNRILAANNSSDGMYFTAATGQGFNFRPNGGTANLVVINSSGNVGIGTTSPNYKLHVAGNSKVDGQTLMTSGFSTYTTDGLFSADALWSGVITPSGAYRVRFGYLDQGGGQYWGRIGFVANTNWSLGTAQGGTSFSIGMGNGNSEFLINNAGKVSIGTSDTNSDKSDFTVYTGSGASLALIDDQVRMGGADVNWGVALRSYGALQTYGQVLYLTTQAGNYAVNVQPNGVTSAQFYQSETYINTYTKISYNWAGGDFGAEQFTIRGTYPSITLRNTQADNKWLFHSDGSGDLRFYQGSTADNNAWTNQITFNRNGQIDASGGNSSQWNTAYSWGNHASAGYLTSYSETDTLASVTARGSSTSTAVTFNGGVNLAADTGIRKSGDNWIIGYSTSLPGIAIGSGTVTDKVSISSGGTQRVWFDTNGKVGIGTSTPAEELHVIGRGIFNGGSGNSSTDAVLYVTKSTNDDWGLYVNNAGLDYGMYTRVSPSAGYAFAIHNGTTWTTRITGDGRVHLNNKDTIASYDSWLRLNQSGEYGSGVYTPGLMRADGGFQVSGSTVWHAGNDGSGSGLDADLLDGQDSSTFLRILSGGSEANLDSYIDNGVRSVSFTGHSQHLLSWNVGGSTGTIQQLFHYGVPNNGRKIRNKTDNSSWSDWGYVVMASSNQGLISGTIATQSWVGSQSYATTSYVTTQINNLINGAPGALDTLDELAAALGDDANFATTVTNSIAAKLPLAGGTMSGSINMNGNNVINIGQVNATHAIFTNDGSSRVMYLRGSGNIIQFQDASANNKWELVGRDGEFYIYKNDGTGAGYKWRIDGVGNHAITGAVSLSSNLNVAGELAFLDGASSYSNIIRAAAYPSEGYPAGQNYWMEYRAKGGHHFVLNTDGGVGSGANTMDDFVIWQGAIDGNRLLEVSNIGNLWIAGALTEASSLKLKENVETSEGNLEKVVNLRPVTYNKIGSQTKELGLIAEEVAEVYPEFVQYDENGDPIGVHYSRLTAALIGAVKELTNQVQELNKKING